MSNLLQIIITLISSLFLLFLPGFFISFLFFDREKTGILERLAISFALSASVIPLLTFYLNLLGIRITKELVIGEIVFIMLVSIGIYQVRKQYRKDTIGKKV